ncbi:MAG: recombination-associated protein RdgC [Aestuariibacter sp.]
MWFKNLKAYTLTDSLTLSPEQIAEKLNEHAFRACGKQELATMGWVSPISGGSDMVHASGNRVWLKLKKQERLLPATVINAELAEKVAQIEQETGSPVGKKAQQDLKQEIVHRLLPQAFTKNSFIHGIVCLGDNLVLVDASADGTAELFLATLRKAIESLPVLPLSRSSIAAHLTDWLQNDNTPEGIELLEEAELKDMSEEGSVLRCKNQDLSAEEIINHIDKGKLVTKLSVSWDETLSCLLQEDVAIKRIKFADVLREQNDDIPKDQLAAKEDADFTLMVGELVRFVEYLKTQLQLTEE